MRGHVRSGLLVAAACLLAGVANAQPFPGSGLLETQLVPDARSAFDDVRFNRNTPIDQFLQDTFSGAWMRVEYLNYQISDPGRVPLGVPLADVEDPTVPFEVTATDDATIHTARVPLLQGIDLNQINGIKGSFGLPVGQFGYIEGSAWGLSTATVPATTDPLPFTSPLGTGPFGSEPITLLATTLYGNGTAGNRLLIYDQDFAAAYTADIWSGEANIVYNIATPQQGLRVQSLLGFRRIQYDENLAFGGTFSNVSDFNTGAGPVVGPLTNSIASKAHNNMYGGQLGARIEYVADRLTFGVEPKVIFSHNRVTARVSTQNLRAAFVDTRTPDPLVIPAVQRLFALNDDAVVTNASDTQFSPGFDIGLYAKLQVTNWLSLRAGYNILWLGNLTTPENNIYYNDDGDTNTTAPNTPGVVVRQTTFSDRFIEGFTIGGEILLP
ncbi:MAG: BBP7 family outer membrane beta-barrel protein [Planctomycetaceae bacterium]